MTLLSKAFHGDKTDIKDGNYETTRIELQCCDRWTSCFLPARRIVTVVLCCECAAHHQTCSAPGPCCLLLSRITTYLHVVVPTNRPVLLFRSFVFAFTMSSGTTGRFVLNGLVVGWPANAENTLAARTSTTLLSQAWCRR